MILLVDDYKDLREVTATVLRTFGYSVLTAKNGREALESVSRVTPGLILLDLRMPVMDGREFLERYRRGCEANAPVVLMTASYDARHLMRELDVAGCLEKPFGIEQLLDCVRQHYSSIEATAATIA